MRFMETFSLVGKDSSDAPLLAGIDQPHQILESRLLCTNALAGRDCVHDHMIGFERVYGLDGPKEMLLGAHDFRHGRHNLQRTGLERRTQINPRAEHAANHGFRRLLKVDVECSFAAGTGSSNEGTGHGGLAGAGCSRNEGGGGTPVAAIQNRIEPRVAGAQLGPQRLML